MQLVFLATLLAVCMSKRMRMDGSFLFTVIWWNLTKLMSSSPSSPSSPSFPSSSSQDLDYPLHSPISMQKLVSLLALDRLVRSLLSGCCRLALGANLQPQPTITLGDHKSFGSSNFRGKMEPRPVLACGCEEGSWLESYPCLVETLLSRRFILVPWLWILLGFSLVFSLMNWFHPREMAYWFLTQVQTQAAAQTKLELVSSFALFQANQCGLSYSIELFLYLGLLYSACLPSKLLLLPLPSPPCSSSPSSSKLLWSFSLASSLLFMLHYFMTRLSLHPLILLPSLLTLAWLTSPLLHPPLLRAYLYL